MPHPGFLLLLSRATDNERSMSMPALTNLPVLAPNGKVYPFHFSTDVSGYVYTLGHRVYGSLGHIRYLEPEQRLVRTFRPKGKWAFILKAIEP